jgi:predicted nucleic acid-binding protein
MSLLLFPRVTKPDESDAVIAKARRSISGTAVHVRAAYELRSNVSTHDASYIALAEQLGCALIAADARLSPAHGPRCPITVL